MSIINLLDVYNTALYNVVDAYKKINSSAHELTHELCEHYRASLDESNAAANQVLQLLTGSTEHKNVIETRETSHMLTIYINNALLSNLTKIHEDWDTEYHNFRGSTIIQNADGTHFNLPDESLVIIVDVY